MQRHKAEADAGAGPGGPRSGRFPPRAVCVGVLAALTVAMFGDLLVSTETVVSSPDTDIRMQFVAWREFGFGQWRQGNLALWNPHLFSGGPYFAGFQSALLYPPNWLHLILPVATAINWGVALHIFLAGLFMFLWASHRGLHPAACLVSGVLFMFCGPVFLRVLAGHLPNLSAIAWVPLIFLVIDGMMAGPSLRWFFLGVLAFSMQILAGHPQYVFYTAVAGVLYGLLCLIGARRRGQAVVGLAAAAGVAVALTAVQTFAGAAAAGESVRGRGISFEFAATFSLPPENAITLLVPGFFGDAVRTPYWGRYYLWEMSLSVGVVGLFLAVLGAWRGERRFRRFSLPVACVLVVLALGVHTPLLRILYDHVPGFDKFRGTCKFILPASAFVLMLAAAGTDVLLRQGGVRGATAALAAMAGAVSGAGGVALRFPDLARTAGWDRLMQAVADTGESFLDPMAYGDAALASQARLFASSGLLITSCILLAIGALLRAARFWRPAVWLILLLAVGEVFVQARLSRASFPLSAARLPEIESVLAQRPGDYRILNPANPNAAMLAGWADIWGYDPGVSRRYAEFVTFTQGGDPDSATQYVGFRTLHPLLGMLRTRFAFVPGPEGYTVEESARYLPRLLLVSRCRVLTGRDAVFAAMAGDFEPSREVILEQEPDPPPAPSERAGTVRLVAESTDWIQIAADVGEATILVITDGYWTGWRAVALPGSVQTRYEVLPGNYVCRAIPLRAGHHAIRLEYRPGAYVAGCWVSGCMVAGLAVAALGLGVKRLRARRVMERACGGAESSSAPVVG